MGSAFTLNPLENILKFYYHLLFLFETSLILVTTLRNSDLAIHEFPCDFPVSTSQNEAKA